MEPAADPLEDGFELARAALDWWSTQTHPPTSSITGGGAIAALEARLGDLLNARAIALPSGSSALRTGLRVLGVCSGDPVQVPTVDWYGATGLVKSVGGIPVGGAGQSADSSKVVMVTPQLLRPRPEGRTVLVDAARLAVEELGALRPHTWDAVALSFGPGKSIDAGEGGALLLRDHRHWRSATALTQHPVRQRLSGIQMPNTDGPAERVHPIAALTALYQLVTLAQPTSPPVPKS